MIREVYIYGLRSNQINKYIYVGSTLNLRHRLARHIKSIEKFQKSRDRLKNIGIEEIEVNRLTMDIFQISNELDRWTHEFDWILKVKSKGHPLLNLAVPFGCGSKGKRY